MSKSYRLNKYISESGFCSRREADEFIKSGQVKVNGIVETVGVLVSDKDEVFVGNERIKLNESKVYIAFNKPQGVTCTTDKKDPTNIVDYVGYPKRIFPVGRLDKDSEGLILLTNDGEIVNQILRDGNAHDKEYIVTVNKAINEKFIDQMSKGVRIHNTVTLPCVVKKIHQRSFSIILTQGLNRQIRLMCEALGYEVMHLKRVRIMNIQLKGIELGTYRILTKPEIDRLIEATKNSVKTEEASTARSGKKGSKAGKILLYDMQANQPKEERRKRKKVQYENKMKKKK